MEEAKGPATNPSPVWPTDCGPAAVTFDSFTNKAKRLSVRLRRYQGRVAKMVLLLPQRSEYLDVGRRLIIYRDVCEMKGVRGQETDGSHSLR